VAWVLLCAAVVMLLVGLHPYLTYPITLCVVPKRPIARGRSPAQVGPISICFCAYNEERVLPQKLENLRRLKDRHPQLEVLAYVDGASDRTGELLSAAREFVQLDWSRTRRGKSHGMNRLVARASTDLVVFTDANVILDEHALERLVPYFADPEVGCVCGHLLYTNPDDSGTAATGSLIWRWEEMLKAVESARGSVMGADGSLFAMRRELHRPVPDDIIDDLYLSLSILCQGKRVIRAEDVLAHENSLTDPWNEFRRKVRIACQAYNVHRLLWPRLRRLGPRTVYMYLSHRYLRWLMPFMLAISAACLVGSLVLLLPIVWFASLLVAGGFLLASAVGLRLWPFTMLTPLTLSLAGVALGVLQSIRGERFQTWESSNSFRRQA
jgi:cellulose synthase/poly-beta-1,6-N-acetylglucosamine synthase-like glycosyltransferase